MTRAWLSAVAGIVALAAAGCSSGTARYVAPAPAPTGAVARAKQFEPCLPPFWPGATFCGDRTAYSILSEILDLTEAEGADGRRCLGAAPVYPIEYWDCIRKEALACRDGIENHSPGAMNEHDDAGCAHLCGHVGLALDFAHLARMTIDPIDKLEHLDACLKELNHEDGGPLPPLKAPRGK